MSRQICIELLDLPFPVLVTQVKNGDFTVTYGEQVKSRLNYAEAAHEFGECVFHALACAGKLDNEEQSAPEQNP